MVAALIGMIPEGLYLLTSVQRSMDRFTDQLSELVKELQKQRHMIH